MNYALICVVATVCSADGYSSVVVVWLTMSLILSCFVLEELFCQILLKGEIVGPFGISCIMKNNMKFAHANSAAEGTHVEQDVPTCGMQHLVFWKQTHENCS